jgi:drug/metabolite transporter (DMT)-like permease
MRSSDLTRLVVLAAIWGGSYTLMRIIAPVLGGTGTAWVRILLAGLMLWGYAAAIASPLEWRKWWKQYLWVGLFNSAIPFSLIAFAMQTLPANYGAVINALAPLFGALFAAFMLSEVLSPRKIAGIALGFVGVAILVRLGPVEVTTPLLIAAASCVLATACYGYISVYTKKYVNGAPNMGLATGTLLLPAIPLGFFAVPTLPTVMPSVSVTLGVLMLALVCSAIAYLLYFKLIRDVGPTKAISVTFLVPLFGVLWGVLFLGETITLTTVVGACAIFGGMALVLGLKIPRPAPAVE